MDPSIIAAIATVTALLAALTALLAELRKWRNSRDRDEDEHSKQG